MNVQTLLHSKVKTAMVFSGLIALLWQLPLAAENIVPGFRPLKQEITLIEAIHHISERYQVLFNYDRAILSDIKVHYDPTSSSNVDEAISAILVNTDLKYQMFNQRYVVLYKNDKEGIESLKEMIQHFQKIVDDKSNEVVIRQKVKATHRLSTTLSMDLLDTKTFSYSISGTVVGQEGEPLIGVNIQVKGTNKGTATDFDGNFTLEDIDENAVLVISYVGYQTQEVTVAGRSSVSITLLSDSQLLDEVVVVGYGTQKKVNLTGSVTEIDFDNQLLNRPITNTSQALSGKVPGLWVSQNSGKPGDDDALLRIRGWGSLNASGPLVIIDGVEGSINSLNPQDIKNVSVLKDAASASIYGSKAANGVILVTTKSGNLNKKPKISLSSYYGIQSIGRNYEMITNSATYMELWNQAEINSGKRPTFPEKVINDFRNNSDPYVYPNTNFDDYMYQNAPLINNNLSISGGSENSKYYISFNHQNQDGIILNTSSKKVGLSLNLESKVKNWISVGGRFHTRIKKINQPYDMERIPYIWSNGGYPFIAPYTKEGLFGGVQALDEKGNPIVSNRNPVIEPYNGFQKSNIYLTRWTGYTDIKLFKGLLWKTNITTLINTQDADKYNEGNLIGYTSNGKQSPNIGLAGYSKFIATRSNVSNITYVGFTTLNYNRKFNKNEIGVIAGTQLEDYERKTAFARSEDHPAAGITQVDGGTKITHAMGNKSGNRMLSYFGRANYAFDDKYLVELNIRADGSSRFAENKRWGVFPGISAGWRIGNEDFMNHQNLFSDLKIRASSGKLGNQNIAGDWPYLSTLSQTDGLSYSFNGIVSPGAALTTLVNDEITWETTTVNDIGVEMFFLENRLKFESTIFQKITDGIIVSLPLPKTMGNSGSPYENVGEMINNGVELDLSFRNRASERNKFGYDLSVNFTYLVNEVTKFRGGKSPDQLYLIREGYSYKSLYAYNAVDIYRTDEEAKNHMHSNGYTPRAGDIKFEDINGDGRLDYQDKKVLGNSIPKVNFGSNIGLSYFGFNLDVLIQGISGVTINYNDRWSMPLGATGGGIPKRWINAWSPDNPDSNLPALKLNDTWNLRRPSSFWAHDLTYMKIRNIQFGYTFPQNMNFLKNMDLNFYCNLQNYVTFVNKGYEGFDPEKNVFLFGDTGERGLSDVYPMPKIITVGINVNF